MKFSATTLFLLSVASTAFACEAPCQAGIQKGIVDALKPQLDATFPQLEAALHNGLFQGVPLPDAAGQQKLTQAVKEAMNTISNKTSTELAQKLHNPIFSKYRGTCPKTPASCNWKPFSKNFTCYTVCGSPGSIMTHIGDVINITKATVQQDLQAQSALNGLYGKSLWTTIMNTLGKVDNTTMTTMLNNFQGVLDTFKTTAAAKFCETKDCSEESMGPGLNNILTQFP